jgi:hypothetical protein
MLAAYTIAGRPQMTTLAPPDDEFGSGNCDFAALIFSTDNDEFDFHCLSPRMRNYYNSRKIKTNTEVLEKSTLQV